MKPWTEHELGIIERKYGLVSQKYLCQLLGRSPSAIQIASMRKLHNGQKASFYTSRQLAEILLGNRESSKKIIGWIDRGWLIGRRSFVKAGPNNAWCFFEEHVTRCLRKYPWLCDLKKMERHYFKSIVQEEYDRDPWYTCDETAPLLGVKTDDAVQRYIKIGWLKAAKKPGGPWQGIWIIRHSEILRFLADDPRPSRSERMSKSRRRYNEEKGKPVRLSVHWSVPCRLCGERVLVMASPGLKGRVVVERFHSIYTNGHCSHGKMVRLGMKEEARS
jgi:hypothetical protein